MNCTKLGLTALAAAALVGGTACREARETGTVTSRSSSGASTAPSAERMEKRDRALVRVINAVPGASSVNLYAGDSVAFSNVPYKTVTPFKQVATNGADWQLKSGPNAEPLAENREAMQDGGHYTIVAMPDEGGADKRNLRVLNDEFHPMPGDKARIRFINAVPGDDNVSLRLRGFKDALFDDVAFKREAGWKEVDPFSGTLEVRGKDKAGVIATLKDVKVQGGRSYTFVASGRPGKVSIIRVEDDVKPAVDTVVHGDTTPRS